MEVIDVAQRDRLLECLSGTEMEPILRGFHEDSGFKSEMAHWVTLRAPAFAVACPDGSHPLVWTSYHHEYRDIFENRITAILAAHRIKDYHVTTFVHFLQGCRELVEAGDIFEGLREGDVEMIQSAVTASEDYDAFLNVMFTEVRRQQFQQQAELASMPPQEPEVAATSLAAGPQTQEIEVMVPEGVGSGQLMAVEYLGLRYELMVPDGFGPGMAFRIAVTVPAC
mmetsp:Transcript_45164/g.79503  ORF Transcript_45164/g.79503 Transcript_45164/m.79503 type:complete len:225 (-) Transcript_45164:37-711(-)